MREELKTSNLNPCRYVLIFATCLCLCRVVGVCGQRLIGFLCLIL
jgi:hypothetical protein